MDNLDKSALNDKIRSLATMETVQYRVEPTDTLRSIAARFDMRCSELKQLNKLTMDQVYTGQMLLIYKKNFVELEKRNMEEKQNEFLDSIDSYSSESSASGFRSRHSSSAASEQLRSRNASGRLDYASDYGSESPFDRIFHDFKKNRLRLEVKYVTDGQGVVSGTLLITNNTVMFHPNVSDRLVLDRGSNSYAMVVPFEYVVRLAIVEDIAAMNRKKGSEGPAPVIYRGKVKEYEFDSDSPTAEPVVIRESIVSQSVGLENEPSLTNTVNGRLGEGENIHSMQTSEKLLTCCTNGSDSNGCVCPHQGNIGKRADSQQILSQESNGSSDQICLRNGQTDNIAQMVEENVTADWPLEKSPRPGLFTLNRCTDSSVCLFSVGDVEQDSDSGVHFAPPLSTQDEDVNVNQIHGIPILVNSSLSRNGSLHTSLSSYEHRTPTSFNQKQGLSAALGYNSSATQLNLIPVYSAKSIARVQSSATISGSVGSFCIPPGQQYMLDYNWEKFGELNTDEEWCTNVRDMPPLPEDSFSQLKQPDFYFSDDDEEDENVCRKKPKVHSSEVDVEKLLRNTDFVYKTLEVLIPRPATQYKDLPMYLSVIIGCPITTKDRRSSVSTATEPISVEMMKPSYWFSIHRCDVDSLFEFIMNHFSNIYGAEDEINPSQRGLTILTQDIIDSKPSTSVSSSFDLELEPLPPAELSENSSILDEVQLAKLNDSLFARAKDCYWKLVYSTVRDGTSLQTLYRKTREEGETDPPSVLVVRDSFKMVFGVVLSCMVKKSTQYFGNGESYLFTFKEGFKKYSATGANEYYGYGLKDGLCFGAYRGKCGLWLDGDLLHGRTQKCVTYGNDVLTLTEDFLAQDVEVWCLTASGF